MTVNLNTSPLPCSPDEVDEFLARPNPEVIAAFRNMPSPLLILGAGGKLGLHVSLMAQRAFDANGAGGKVVAVSRFRTLRDRSDFDRFKLETIACDLESPDELAALPDARAVCFLAGVKFGTSSDPDLLQRLNVEMPARVAERFRAARIVAFSTGCVYPFATAASGGATEQTPTQPVGAYAESCLAREQAFEAVSNRHGTSVALLRLNYAVEFRYGVLLDVAQKVFQGIPVDVTTGYANVIWQTDAVAQALRSFDHTASPAFPLNVTGSTVLKVRDIAVRFGEILGRRAVITGFESETAWLSNAAQARRIFGEPAVSTEQMMRWVAEWLRQGLPTWGKPTGFERRDGKF